MVIKAIHLLLFRFSKFEMLAKMTSFVLHEEFFLAFLLNQLATCVGEVLSMQYKKVSVFMHLNLVIPETECRENLGLF